MGVPLSVFRGARLPGEAWTQRDAALAQAAKQLDWSRCPGCGVPRWIGHDDTALFTPHRSKCEGCESIEILKEKQPEDLRNPQAYYFHTEHVGYVEKKR